MRLWILALPIASLLTLSISPRFALADVTPASQPPGLVSEAVAPQQDCAVKQVWELDGAFFKALSSQGTSQIGTARLTVRRFLTDSLSVGADFRYWPSGSYPLTNNIDSGAWAAGGGGQLYLFKSNYIGAYIASSLLWVPTYSTAALAPEVGFKWFASNRMALGISYWIMTDISSYTTSFEPQFTGKSRQNLGFELSVFL